MGVIVGLLPSLLIQFLEPKSWMVTMTKAGFWMMVILFAPGFFRGIIVLALSIWRGRSEDNAQTDHDFSEFNRLQVWLAKFPKQTLEQHLRFIQAMQARLLAKLPLIGGGFERFGILPLVLAISVQMKAFTADSLDLPIWQRVRWTRRVAVSAANPTHGRNRHDNIQETPKNGRQNAAVSLCWRRGGLGVWVGFAALTTTLRSRPESIGLRRDCLMGWCGVV